MKFVKNAIKQINDIISPAKRRETKKCLRYVNLSPNKDPMYANPGDSGFDLRSWITKTSEGAYIDETSGEAYIEIGPGEIKLIHTGLYFDIPDNCELQVRPRSGFSLKVGISLNNSPGTIDVGYTGEVGLICINPTNKPIKIYNGKKIAQAVLCPVYNEPLVTLIKTDRIEKHTQRGSKGYGDSGIN